MFSLEVYNYLNSNSYLNRDKNYKPKVEPVEPLRLPEHIKVHTIGYQKNLQMKNSAEPKINPEMKKIFTISATEIEQLVNLEQELEEVLNEYELQDTPIFDIYDKLTEITKKLLNL